MALISRLFADWITREPIPSLLLAVVVVLLFGAEFARSPTQVERAWGRRLSESLVKALAFAGLLGGFYFLLDSSANSFRQLYGSFTTGGSLSRQAWQRQQKLYGKNFTQADLQVTQYIEMEKQAVIQPSDPSQPLLYRNFKVEEPLAQNSILRFRGNVTMTMADPVHPHDTFNSYTLSARYEYEIVNPADTETRVEFNFPLSGTPKLYEALNVQMNGEAAPHWRVASSAIVWESRLRPRETSTVSIQYVTRGMDGFVFEVLTPREVKDFEYRLAVNSDNWGLLTEPENGGLQVEIKQEAPYQIITWKIGRAILAPRLGLAINQTWPYAPYQAMVATLPYAARASLLFLSMLTLWLLICGVPVRLRQLALLAGLFAIPFLLLMAGGLPAPKFIAPAHFAGYQVKLLPGLALLPLSLAFITLRKLPRLPLGLSLSLMAFFLAGYPFVGLLPDEQKRNVFEVMIQVGLLACTFSLVLYIRLRGTSDSPKS